MAYYSWILAFHVMSFVSWMAMLFYQPRLFVYHSENGDNEGFVKVVQRQEYILNKAIGTPAMWATILSGATMLYLNSGIFSSGGWMHAKLLALVFLIAYHFSLESLRKNLIINPHYKSGKWFRFYNEVPTLLMIFIVIMVVVKPF
jgi:putative membrane protein